MRMQLLAWPRESKGLNRQQTKHTCSDQWRWRMPAVATPLKSSAVQRFRQLAGGAKDPSRDRPQRIFARRLHGRRLLGGEPPVCLAPLSAISACRTLRHVLKSGRHFNQSIGHHGDSRACSPTTRPPNSRACEVLPSTASAEGEPSLFGRFIGITPSSDSSSACMLIVRLLPA